MTFLSTLSATFIGVLGALGVQEYIMRKGLRLKKKEERERKKYILEIVKGEIEHNIKLLEQIHDEYQKSTWSGYYNLDTTSKQATWSDLIKIEESAKFIYDLSRTYYEYEHMNRKLDLQLRLVSDANIHPTVADFRRTVVRSIVVHTTSLISGSKDRLKEIEEKLNSFS